MSEPKEDNTSFEAIFTKTFKQEDFENHTYSSYSDVVERCRETYNHTREQLDEDNTNGTKPENK